MPATGACSCGRSGAEVSAGGRSPAAGGSYLSAVAEDEEVSQQHQAQDEPAHHLQRRGDPRGQRSAHRQVLRPAPPPNRRPRDIGGGKRPEGDDPLRSAFNMNEARL